MNEQQIQQILTIQQAIAAAATAAVINSLLNPQQAAAGLTNPNTNALTEALQNSQNQLELQQQQQQQQQHHNQQHQHQHQQQNLPDSRQDSPLATSSSPANSNQPLNDANRIQELLLQLQQQAAIANTTQGGPAPQLQQQQQAALLAALNLNLNNASNNSTNINNNNLSLQQQLQAHLNGSPLSRSPMGNRLQLGQTDLNLSAAPTAATGSNISNQSSPNKKLKQRHLQQPVVPPFSQHTRSSLEATSKPQQHQSTPKSQHSAISNLGNSRNSTSNSSASSSFLPNNVGLPRKLVRGQDVWLGRGAEQTRQILKCMWCGQSFRTLAEMTQHMRETQHYTNIISQEQITSWRQPDGNEPSSNKHNSKQSSHSARLMDDHLGDMSEKFDDSEDGFSNEDEPSQKQRNSTKGKMQGKSPATKRESSSADSSIHDSTTSSTLKCSTKNRKREHEDNVKPVCKREKLDGEQSPSSTSSSQQRVLSDLNEDSKANKEQKLDLDDHESASNEPARKADSDEEPDEEPDESSSPLDESENVQSHSPESEHQEDTTSKKSIEDGDDDKDAEDEATNDSVRSNDEETEENLDGDATKEHVRFDDEENKGDNRNSRRPNKKSHIDINSAGSAKVTLAEGQRGDGSGDPLSALETMVEKSFDPRLRPGLSSGGILQRLGIDEEVCPPWQHINYANWYAAAAYGHPMAAALLAAGINLQNGIKLGKNISSKKADED